MNFGFRRENWPGETDWASDTYKGECGLGQPVTGLSKYLGDQNQAHAVLCGTTTISGYSQASCHGIGFYPANNPPGLGDWDPYYVKGECAANEYVQGIGQDRDGLLNAIYCCQGCVTHSACDSQVFYSGDSAGYGTSPDWDPQFSKGQCPAGQYVAGVGVVYFPSTGTPGAPHAILCCTP